MRMRDLLRTTGLSAATALALTGAGFAQQAVPAEIPPASYTADQYVDSSGCVFVRVGFGAATEWVPRVGRDRQQICGQSPTRVAGAGPAPGSADPANPGPGVTVIGAAPAAALAPAPAAPPARTVVRQAPAPTGGTGLRVVTAPPVVTTARPPQSLRVAPNGCAGLTGLTAQYLSGPGQRCGPQAVHPGDAARGIVRPGPTFDPASASPPEGWRPAWEDDRTNPLRGVGTYAGDAEMGLVWTDTVPRRLVGAEPRRGLAVIFGTRSP